MDLLCVYWFVFFFSLFTLYTHNCSFLSFFRSVHSRCGFVSLDQAPVCILTLESMFIYIFSKNFQICYTTVNIVNSVAQWEERNSAQNIDSYERFFFIFEGQIVFKKNISATFGKWCFQFSWKMERKNELFNPVLECIRFKMNALSMNRFHWTKNAVSKMIDFHLHKKLIPYRGHLYYYITARVACVCFYYNLQQRRLFLRFCNALMHPL